VGEPLTTAREPSSKPTRVPLVLLVEDDDDTRQIYAEALVSAGYAAVGVRTWFEAEAIVYRLRPEAIVMDRMLPDADGWDVARRLKRGPATANTPIIALTGSSEQASVLEALDAGCDVFLAKPCTTEALLAALAKVLANAEATGRRRTAQVASGDPKEFASSFGQAIRSARQARGWTQAELAEAAGLSTNYLARLERGEIGASLLVARKIGEALGVGLDALVGGG
jgi:two-component system, cell cycle response regulator DivK